MYTTSLEMVYTINQLLFNRLYMRAVSQINLMFVVVTIIYLAKIT